MEIIKLRELADIQTGPFGSQLHKEDYVQVGTPIVTVEHLGKRVFSEQNLPRVDDKDKMRLKKYSLLEGDIVFSRVGAIDRSSYVDKEHEGWLFSGRCLRIRPYRKVYPLYLYYYLQLERVKSFIRSIAVGATMPSINTSILGKVNILVPEIAVQKNIANQMAILDDKIELSNDLNRKLQQFRQAMLTKLFPREGAAEPELRFRGFSGKWESIPLGEVGSAQSGVGFPECEQGGQHGIPFFKVSDMNNIGNEREMKVAKNYVTDEQIVNNGWHPIEDVPAIMFAKVGAAVMLNRKRLIRTPFLLDNNTMAYKLDKSWDAGFAQALFEQIDLTSLIQVGALPSYNASDVEGIIVKRPELNEQKAIGDFFYRLDRYISLQQKKLERMQRLKAALLEKLFV